MTDLAIEEKQIEAEQTHSDLNIFNFDILSLTSTKLLER